MDVIKAPKWDEYILSDQSISLTLAIGNAELKDEQSIIKTDKSLANYEIRDSLA